MTPGPAPGLRQRRSRQRLLVQLACSVLLLGGILRASSAGWGRRQLQGGSSSGGHPAAVSRSTLAVETLEGQQQALRPATNQTGAGAGAAAGDGTTYGARLAACSSLKCLRELHDSSAPRFHFPHFFIIGWQKAATTAIYRHLEKHPQALPCLGKEPHFFTRRARMFNFLRRSCSISVGCAQNDAEYIASVLLRDRAAAAGGGVAAFEASADYAKFGPTLAPLIRRELPWLKIVASMREPINQALSLLNHHQKQATNNLMKGRPCLLSGDAYTCLKRVLTEESENKGLARGLEAYLKAFPASQIHVLQYENLTAPGMEPLVLADLKRFLGLDPALPEGPMEKRNVRRSEGGYPITRQQYQELVELARLDAERVAELLAAHGLGGGAPWLRAWEEVWERQLAACPDGGSECRLGLS